MGTDRIRLKSVFIFYAIYLQVMRRKIEVLSISQLMGAFDMSVITVSIIYYLGVLVGSSKSQN